MYKQQNMPVQININVIRNLGINHEFSRFRKKDASLSYPLSHTPGSHYFMYSAGS